MNRIFRTLLFVLVDLTYVEAQKFKIKDVAVEDLQSLSFDQDSTAGAVILHDVGKLRGDNLEFTRQMRIKILKKSGLEWGNRVFNLPSRGDFKVNVYNLENGEIIREKATPKTIYSEEVVEGYFVFKVFAPNVRVGSIIDIQYTHFGPPREWWFQNRIPVVFSELTMEPNKNLSYNKNQFGFERIQTVNEYTWRGQNLPAFRTEPYLSDVTNYITKFTIQLTSFSALGTGYFAYLDLGSSWKAINNRLVENSRIKDALQGGNYLRDFLKETKEKNLGNAEKIQAAYDYVQRNLKWDDYKTIFPSTTLRSNFTEGHTGNSADINLTLVSLLNDLGITTYPLVLSTRENGMILPYVPDLGQLNYVVAYIKHGDIEMLVDATTPGIMPGILPAFCINGSGLIVRKDLEYWIELTPKQSSVKRQASILSLDKSGEVKGTVNNTYIGYGYLSWAEEMKEHNHDMERVKNQIQKDNPDVTITKYAIANNEPTKVSARETVELDASEQLIDAGEQMLFNPFLLTDLDVNPFLSETRQYPIDMNFPKELSSTVTLTLKGLAVKQLPESIRFAIPDKSASFTYTAGVTANSVQLKVVLKIERQVYTETEYLDLRRFYVEVVKKVGSMIEFTKL